MSGQDADMGEFGLDDDFSDADTLGGADAADDSFGGMTPSDGIVTEPGGESEFGDLDVGTGADDVFATEGEDLLGTSGGDVSSGGSDFDLGTVSDEVSDTDEVFAETDAGASAGFEPAAGEDTFGEDMLEPAAPESPKKKMLTMVGVAVIALVIGGVFKLFAWPMVSGLIGDADSKAPQLDVQAQVNNETRTKARLQKEMKEFSAIGGPQQVKALQKELAQVRKDQGEMPDFENTYNQSKEQEAAYDALITRIDEIEAGTSQTRADIRKVKAQIEDTREKVIQLAKESETAFERFQLELARFEFSQLFLNELRLEDIASFEAQIAEFEDDLERIVRSSAEAEPPEAPPETTP